MLWFSKLSKATGRSMALPCLGQKHSCGGSSAGNFHSLGKKALWGYVFFTEWSCLAEPGTCIWISFTVPASHTEDDHHEANILTVFARHSLCVRNEQLLQLSEKISYKLWEEREPLSCSSFLQIFYILCCLIHFLTLCPLIICLLSAYSPRKDARQVGRSTGDQPG